VILIAAAGLYVAKDRAHVESLIRARQSAYVQCSQRYRGRKLATKREQRCGWTRLSAIRNADLLGLPFLVLTLGMALLLIYKTHGIKPDDTTSTLVTGAAEEAISTT
jgi:hypothetical protein